MRKLNKEDTAVVVTVLTNIKDVLRTYFLIKFDKDMYSPFDNTGAKYSCDAFTVRAYDWNFDDVDNFVYEGGLKAKWYKYLGRGDEVYVPDDWTAVKLQQMYLDCVQSIRKDFGEI